VIGWLTRRLSRDPGQLGFLEALLPPLQAPAPSPSPTRHAPSGLTEEVGDIECTCVDSPPGVRLVAPPLVSRDPDALLTTLRAHGLRGVEKLVLTRNRHTMVSVRRGVMRVHEGFIDAPSSVHQAIATFATSRDRARRNAARTVIVEYPIPIRAPKRRPAALHPDDQAMAQRLSLLHAQLNLEHFGGALAAIEVQVSRRIARRLGHYTMRHVTGDVGDIVISRGHVRRDGWAEATQTLLHEMVHQWQDETGRPVDHGAGFRAKCREVGITAAATRVVAR
jgi:hypothetical protein